MLRARKFSYANTYEYANPFVELTREFRWARFLSIQARKPWESKLALCLIGKLFQASETVDSGRSCPCTRPTVLTSPPWLHALPPARTPSARRHHHRAQARSARCRHRLRRKRQGSPTTALHSPRQLSPRTLRQSGLGRRLRTRRSARACNCAACSVPEPSPTSPATPSSARRCS